MMLDSDSVEALKKKFPVTHGRDSGEKLTLGEIIERMGRALDADASDESRREIASDILDRDLLFGAWGNRWTEQDWLLLRDIRGAIVTAYKVGKSRAQSQEQRPSDGS